MDNEQLKKLELQVQFVSKANYYLNLLKLFLFFLSASILAVILLLAYFNFYPWYFKSQGKNLQSELLVSVNNPVYKSMQNVLKPQNLYFSSKNILKNRKNHYDLVSFINNPNTLWYAKIKYHFELANYKSDIYEASVYPKENRAIWDLNVVSNNLINDFKVVLDDVSWFRSADYANRVKKYLNFSFNDINLNTVDLEDGKSYSKIDFTLKNNTVFNFHKLAFVILFKRYDNLAYFYYQETENLEALEARKISISLSDNLEGITNVQIIPLLDLYDDSNIYIK